VTLMADVTVMLLEHCVLWMSQLPLSELLIWFLDQMLMGYLDV
jgi:hypothetical protein